MRILLNTALVVFSAHAIKITQGDNDDSEPCGWVHRYGDCNDAPIDGLAYCHYDVEEDTCSDSEPECFVYAEMKDDLSFGMDQPCSEFARKHQIDDLEKFLCERTTEKTDCMTGDEAPSNLKECVIEKHGDCRGNVFSCNVLVATLDDFIWLGCDQLEMLKPAGGDLECHRGWESGTCKYDLMAQGFNYDCKYSDSQFDCGEYGDFSTCTATVTDDGKIVMGASCEEVIKEYGVEDPQPCPFSEREVEDCMDEVEKEGFDWATSCRKEFRYDCRGEVHFCEMHMSKGADDEYRWEVAECSELPQKMRDQKDDEV